MQQDRKEAMLSVLHYSFSAVMPIIMMILVGVLARRSGYLTKNLLRGINKFTFRFAFTALMFVNIYEIKSIRDMPLDLAVFALLALTFLLFVGGPHGAADYRSRGDSRICGGICFASVGLLHCDVSGDGRRFASGRSDRRMDQYFRHVFSVCDHLPAAPAGTFVS